MRSSVCCGGNTTVWVLLSIVVLGVLGFVIVKMRTPPPVAPVIALATPAPATPPPATPEPVVVKATPTPAPIVFATPTPAPTATPLPTLDLATVERTRALWPAQVAFLQAKSLPLYFNGRMAGEATVPAGTTVRLLRVTGQQVEVEYQGQRHMITAATTDLMTRALATFRRAGSVLPPATAVVSAAPTGSTVSAAPALAAAAPPAMTTSTVPAMTTKSAANGKVKIGDRMMIEVVRQKKSRIEGGDYDDKQDHIVLKVKVSNPDPSISADKLKGEVFVLGESIVDRSAAKMLHRQEFTFALPPRGTHELVTDETVTAYDTTDARFGYKYEGWILRIHDETGALIVEKSSIPSLLKNAAKIAQVSAGKDFDRTTIKIKDTVGTMRR